MKFTIDKSTMGNALDLIYPICGKKTTLPILSHAMLQIEGGRIGVMGSDLDLTVKITGEIKSDSGALAVPCARFRDIVKNSAGPEVHIEQSKGDRLIIQSGAANHSIACLPASEYPPEPTLSKLVRFEISQGRLKSMLHQVAWAIYTRDDSRPVIQNTAFQCSEKGGLRVVATNGHALAVAEDSSISGQFDFMLPSNACKFLLANLSERDDLVIVDASENHARFQIGEARLTARLCEGNFPNWKGVIPSGHKTTLECSRAAVIECISRAASVRTENHNSVLMSIGDNRVTFSAKSEIGEASDSFDAKAIGPNVEIEFNPDYTRQCMAAAPQDAVEMRFIDNLSAVKIVAGNWMAVIMPMRPQMATRQIKKRVCIIDPK